MRIRILVTAVVEYDVPDDQWPAEVSPHEYLEKEIEHAEPVPLAFLDREDTQWKVTGEIV